MGATEILLVDDEQDILDIGLTVLNRAGYRVLPALNGDIAMILVEQGLPFRQGARDAARPADRLYDGLFRRGRHPLTRRPLRQHAGQAMAAARPRRNRQQHDGESGLANMAPGDRERRFA
jgi:CheY-like chemotaxis protein